jgi:hypothetical protein
MTRVKPLRFHFVMLATSLTSAGMTWGIVFYGFITHPVRAYQIFSKLDPTWSLAALALAGFGVALSVVSLLRRDPAGIIGLVCSLGVLSGTWMRFVPIV